MKPRFQGNTRPSIHACSRKRQTRFYGTIIPCEIITVINLSKTFKVSRAGKSNWKIRSAYAYPINRVQAGFSRRDEFERTKMIFQETSSLINAFFP